MFSKPLSQLTYEDIYDLVEIRKEPEGHQLDYKSSYIKNPEKAKSELAKDVSAFANSGGGYLIIGISEGIGNDGFLITGEEKLFGKKNTEEWINQILSSNIEPQLFYHDPKVIVIPETEKVVIIIHVPESSNKPHMVNDGNTYYLRINDSCKLANHQSVRDMFNYSRSQNEELERFLKKRNLLNEESESFGINNNSKKLYSQIEETGKSPKPAVIFSLIPKEINKKKNSLPPEEIINWASENSTLPIQGTSRTLFNAYNSIIHFDGILFQNKNQGILSYFDIFSNGYLEGGLSNTIAYKAVNPISGNDLYCLHLSTIMAYEILLLNFSKKLYSLIKYENEIVMQISFVNMLNFSLYGLHEYYPNNSMRFNEMSPNTRDNNFKILLEFEPELLTDEKIILVAKEHSTLICNAFGLDKDYCFRENKLSDSFRSW